MAVGEPAAGSPPKKINVVHVHFSGGARRKPAGNVKAHKLATIVYSSVDLQKQIDNF